MSLTVRQSLTALFRRQSRKGEECKFEDLLNTAVTGMKITRRIPFATLSFWLVLLSFTSEVVTPRATSSSSPSLSVSPSPSVPVHMFPRSPFPLFPRPAVPPSQSPEYLWYEAENMRGFSTTARHEPVLNPSYLNYPKAKAPGWGINGPGVSAEWSQGGESEWNSAAASADEAKATIYQDIEVPRAGDYKVWVRYADWARRTESFTIRITQGTEGATGRRGDGENARNGARPTFPVPLFPRFPVSFTHEFGAKDVIDPHDEISMYWSWAFAWDGASVKLEKGPARISIEIEKAAGAPRQVDCVLVTNDSAYVPSGRRKPDFAAMRYLHEWAQARTPRTPLSPVIEAAAPSVVPRSWQRPRIAGRDFCMPWNISKEFWPLYDKPAAERPLYPFNAEPTEEFVKTYKGAPAVPIFDSKLVVPVIYIPHIPELLKEGSPFLRYLRETKAPFAVLINYGTAAMSPADAQAVFKLLTGELRDQFLGWVSGESVGYVWDSSATDLKISPSMTRQELLEAHRVFYTTALDKKWGSIFQTATGPMWDKLIPAQSTSSTSFAHALAEWGVRLLGMETAAVQPMFAMRIAFTRGAARQFGGAFAYYHAPNFGDTATTFTNAQNFAGPGHFFHSRYGATMGPSLSWYRKSYYLYYMSGVSAIYLEQGFDQFFKPGPGEHPYQLNPLGRITHEFMRFAEKHPDRGTPYTPVAFLLDRAHGWEMTDYPQWPFGVSQINRSDRALRELFGVAYYPGLVVEGEPATADRQAFVNGIFGDIFDVIVTSEGRPSASSGRPSTSSVQRRLFTGTAGVSPAPATRSLAKGFNAHAPKTDFQRSPLSASPRLRVSASPRPPISVSPLSDYRAVVVGGHIEWSPAWSQRLTDYVRGGGTVVLNAAQIKGLPEQLLGIRLAKTPAESDSAKCLAEPNQDLAGQMFRYEKVELKGATALITAATGDPLVTVNKLGKGSIIFSALPDLLGIDERVTPFAAHMLAHIFSDATPVRVRGDVEYLINRTDTTWVVTLFNNNGVHKPQQGLAQVDRSAIVNATITVPGQQLRSATDWITDKPLEVNKTQNSVSVTLPPGAVVIVELK